MLGEAVELTLRPSRIATSCQRCLLLPVEQPAPGRAACPLCTLR